MGKKVGVKNGVKFKVQSELSLFDALQRHGRLPVDALSRHASLARTASYYGAKRLSERGLFDFRAMPRLSQFTEVPMLLLGFDNLKTSTLEAFAASASDIESIRMLVIGKKAAFVFVMGQSPTQLNDLSISMTQRLGQPPRLSVLSPRIAKLDLTIPAPVLKSIYAHLPDRRGT